MKQAASNSITREPVLENIVTYEIMCLTQFEYVNTNNNFIDVFFMFFLQYVKLGKKIIYLELYLSENVVCSSVDNNLFYVYNILVRNCVYNMYRMYII